MRTFAPGTVTVAVLTVTGCSSFGLRDGGQVAHKAAPAGSAFSSAPVAAVAPRGDALAALDNSRSNWQQAFVAEQLQQGAHHEQRSRWREAAGCYERALQKDPRNVTAHHRLAIVNDLQGHFVEAEQHYLAALETDIANCDILSDLGYSYLLQRRFRESEQALREALQHQPSHQFALGHLGTLYGLQGDFPRAKEYLTRAGGEVMAERELARLFPQGAAPNPAIALSGRGAALDFNQTGPSAAATVKNPANDTLPIANEATRKLAEQIGQERQKLLAAGSALPAGTQTGSVDPTGGRSTAAVGRAADSPTGPSAAAFAKQRRHADLDYLNNGPPPPSELNRLFSQLDAQATRSLNPLANGQWSGNTSAAGVADASRRDVPGSSLRQTAGTANFGSGGPSARDVTIIPTNPPQAGVEHIPTQITDAPGNPFAVAGTSTSVDQARATATPMGMTAGSGLLPPVTAPNPASASSLGPVPMPTTNASAVPYRSESILMQPPVGSPTVQQALAAAAARQPPPWSPQAMRSAPAGAASPTLPPITNRSNSPSVGTPANPQLITISNGAGDARLLPNADGTTNMNLLPGASVGTDNVRPAGDPGRSPVDLMNQFQQQQQQLLQLQQELDRVRQQGGSYQMYQHSSGLPSQQAVPR